MLSKQELNYTNNYILIHAGDLFYYARTNIFNKHQQTYKLKIIIQFRHLRKQSFDVGEVDTKISSLMHTFTSSENTKLQLTSYNQNIIKNFKISNQTITTSPT